MRLVVEADARDRAVAPNGGNLVRGHTELACHCGNVRAADGKADRRANIAQDGAQELVVLVAGSDVEEAHLRQVLESERESDAVLARLRQECGEIWRGVLGQLVDVDEERVEVHPLVRVRADAVVAAGGGGVRNGCARPSVGGGRARDWLRIRPRACATLQDRIFQLHEQPRAQ